MKNHMLVDRAVLLVLPVLILSILVENFLQIDQKNVPNNQITPYYCVKNPVERVFKVIM